MECFSEVLGPWKSGCSEAGRAGAVGGDIAPAADGGPAASEVAGTDDRIYPDAEPVSRGGLSVSEPRTEDMDMLLPGRCPESGGSRGAIEDGGGGGGGGGGAGAPWGW